MKYSKTKGSAFERKVAEMIADYLKVPHKLVRRSQPVDPYRQMHGDIEISETLENRWRWIVECKCVEKWTLEGFLTGTNLKYLDWAEQVIDDTPKGKLSVVFFTRNYTGVFAYVPLAHEELPFIQTPILIPSINMGFILPVEKFFYFESIVRKWLLGLGSEGLEHQEIKLLNRIHDVKTNKEKTS